MPIPELTNLQFLVLGLLLDREMEGRDLRSLVAGRGGSMGRPAFYRLMSRLEEAKLAEGWYELRKIDGETVRVRKYKITTGGKVACREMQLFVASVPSPTQPGLGIQGA